jgi:predicted RNA-binding Zn-ribbon protein involved in translation (DUF1610 family)
MVLFPRKPQLANTNLQQSAWQQTPHQQYQPTTTPRGYFPQPVERTPPQRKPVQQTSYREPQRGNDQLGGFPTVPKSGMVPTQLRQVVEQCPWCGQAYLLYASDSVTKDGKPAVKYECPNCKHPVIFVPHRFNGGAYRIYPTMK